MQGMVQVSITTVAIIIYQRHGPIGPQISHIVSLAETLASLGASTVWLYAIAPRWYPGTTLPQKVAQVAVQAYRHTFGSDASVTGVDIGSASDVNVTASPVADCT